MEDVAAGQFLGERDKQEDALRVVRQDDADSDDGLLLLLSDGMGGHAGGEIASNTAIDALVDHFNVGSTNMRPRGRLKESLEVANSQLAKKVDADPTLKGMGCTMIGVLVAGGRIVWVSVGDSVLFLVRNGALKKLNADHSYFGELMKLVEKGELKEEEAKAHPKRNALLSVLTGAPIKLIDVDMMESQPGDLLIVASDGLETLSQPEILTIARDNLANGANAVTDALLGAVEDRQKPKQDNTSVISLIFPGDPKIMAQEHTQWDMSPDKPSNTKLIVVSAAAGALLMGLFMAFLLWPDPPVPPVAEVAPEPIEPRNVEIRPDGPSAIQEDAPIPPEEAPSDGDEKLESDSQRPQQRPDFVEEQAEPAEDVVPVVPDVETPDVTDTGQDQ